MLYLKFRTSNFQRKENAPTCGCPFPIRTNKYCISSLTALLLECILAIIWGNTTNHISILTSEKPFCKAIWTSEVAPWLNQSVRRRRISYKTKNPHQSNRNITISSCKMSNKWHNGSKYNIRFGNNITFKINAGVAMVNGMVLKC